MTDTNRILTLALAALLPLASCSGDPDDFSPEEWRTPAVTYRSMPFWSLNDSLSTDGIREQLRLFKVGGFGGAFLHSRIGLLTPYLSEEWFRMMDAGVDACEALGLEAWFYDEDKWPSGFAGGVIPRMSGSYRSHSLAKVPVGTPLQEGDTILCRSGQWQYVSVVDKMGRSWFNGACWVDLMNPGMVDAFIESTYKPYYDRYGGRACAKGIFSDEPQVKPQDNCYNAPSVPYSPCMEAVFRQMWGYDLDPVLPSLLDTVGDWRKVRLHYYRTVAQCMETAFSANIGGWCEDRGWLWTGHYNGEQTTDANMTNEGDLMTQLRNMGQPGIDALGLRLQNWHNDKVCTSVANQYGRRRRLVEIFGIGGHNLSFEDRMWLTARQTLCGANFMCPHLSLYSMKGERKRDYPPTINYQEPYWAENKLFEDWSARMCYFATVGRTRAEACVISPIESDYIVSGPVRPGGGRDLTDCLDSIINLSMLNHVNIDIVDEQILDDIGEVSGGRFRVGEMSYRMVLVPHLYTMRPSTSDKLEEFRRQGGEVVFIGGLPEFLDGVPAEFPLFAPEALSQLECRLSAFAKGWNIKGDGAEHVLSHIRDVGNGWTLQLSNVSRSEGACVELDFAWDGGIALMDPRDGRCLGFENGSSLSLAPAQSWVLWGYKGRAPRQDGAYSPSRSGHTIDVSRLTPQSRHRTCDNALVLDFARFSRDGGATWSDPEPVLGFYKRSERVPYNGSLSLRYSFDVKDLPPTCSLCIEQPWMYKSITVNGEPAGGWSEDYYVDRAIRRTDISYLVHAGLNEVVLSLDYKSPVTTSPDAVERYGTEIETIYVTGDFAVDCSLAGEQPTTTWRNKARHLAPKPLPTRFAHGSFSLAAERPSSAQGLSVVENLTDEGYPFYAGGYVYEGYFDMPSVEDSVAYCLDLSGVEAIYVKVAVNGVDLPTVYSSPWSCDLGTAVREGRNTFRLEIVGSLRNLMGPYHCSGAEFNCVGPSTFAGAQDWPNPVKGESNWYDVRLSAEPEIWRDDYYCIPFGIL